jgi:hypothetical protein
VKKGRVKSEEGKSKEGGGGGMNRAGPSRPREGEALLAETWLRVSREWDGGWGIQAADLMDLLAMLIEADGLRDAVKSGRGEGDALLAECKEVFKKMEKAARAVEMQCREIGNGG